MPPELQVPNTNPEDVFDVTKIQQPAGNKNILKPVTAKLTGKQKRYYTEQVQNYENIVNWSDMSDEEIETNIEIGRTHLP